MNQAILEAVRDALQAASEDVQLQPASTLSFSAVAVEVQAGKCVLDGSDELNCRLRVQTPEGPAGDANCWVLDRRFWQLFDVPPVVAWLNDPSVSQQLLQVTGRIRGEAITVNLWQNRETRPAE